MSDLAYSALNVGVRFQSRRRVDFNPFARLNLMGPAPALDLVPPAVTRVGPPSDAELAPGQPLLIRVSDDKGLRRSVLLATFADVALEEWIWNGDRFASAYATFSTVTPSNSGKTLDFSLRRTPGWPSSPSIDVITIDLSGNEAA